MEVVSHADFTRLHPTFGHPESPERLAVLLETFPDFVQCAPASEEDVLRCHAPDHLELVRSIREPTWLDPDTVASETTFEKVALLTSRSQSAVRAAVRVALARCCASQTTSSSAFVRSNSTGRPWRSTTSTVPSTRTSSSCSLVAAADDGP